MENRETRASASMKNKEFYKAIELQSGVNGTYYHVRYFAAKIAEQSRRIAGVISLFENSSSEEISEKNMSKGITLAQWYLDEVLRIHNNENLEDDAMNFLNAINNLRTFTLSNAEGLD